MYTYVYTRFLLAARYTFKHQDDTSLKPIQKLNSLNGHLSSECVDGEQPKSYMISSGKPVLCSSGGRYTGWKQ